MRFLLFNIVVAGALIFLFAGDKDDLHAAADRAHDAATGLKAKAFEIIGAKKTPSVEKTPKTATRPATATTGEKPKSAPANPAENPHAGTAAADAVKEVRVATRKLVPPLPKEVAMRREEVLSEGIVGENVSAIDESVKQRFMAASDRKRDLMLLSEEMELFSARSIGR